MIKPGNIKRARILIVDDCADSAGLLADLLELHGYDGIHRTSDAAAVCDLHEVNHYALILLDLHMPFVNGLKIMAQMRKLSPGSFLPVIVLSGDDNLRPAALKAGAYDFIAKPFNATDLVTRVRRMLTMRLMHRYPDKHEQRPAPAGRAVTPFNNRPEHRPR